MRIIIIAEALGTGELRRTTARPGRHRSGSIRSGLIGSGSIRSELIARGQGLFNAQSATNEGILGFIFDRWLRDDEFPDVRKKTFDKVEITTKIGNEVRNLISKCFDLT